MTRSNVDSTLDIYVQYIFAKMRGGGVKVVWNFPKMHPICSGKVSLFSLSNVKLLLFLFTKKNLDLWCGQDWRGNEEDKEDGQVYGRDHRDDQFHQLSN